MSLGRAVGAVLADIRQIAASQGPACDGFALLASPNRLPDCRRPFGGRAPRRAEAKSSVESAELFAIKTHFSCGFWGPRDPERLMLMT